jgi:hypothetical protein
MNLYNDQRNAQALNLFVYLRLPYMFRAFFYPSSEARVQFRQWFKSAGYGVSAWGLTPYPARLEPLPNLYTCL